MAWEGSNRRGELPTNWPALREQRRKIADGICEWIKGNGVRCDAEGTDCDHWVNKHDHRIESLRWLCPRHHGRKSSAEGLAAQRPRPTRFREPEPHPGG
jgi:5-methylcytosine-specific restriction protein A